MRTPVLAVVALAAALLSGCGPKGAPAGDPGPRPDCVVADEQGEVIAHPGTLVPGRRPVSVVGVDLAGSYGLLTVEAVAVPWSGRTDIHGLVHEYPPEHGIADSLADWRQRRDLDGLALRPGDQPQAVLFALRLSDPETLGKVGGFLVHERRDGVIHQVRLPQPLVIKPHGEICTVEDAQPDPALG